MLVGRIIATNIEMKDRIDICKKCEHYDVNYDNCRLLTCNNTIYKLVKLCKARCVASTPRWDVIK